MSESNFSPVSREIEDAYSEIGRSVVQQAIAQVQTTGQSTEAGVETSVTMRLLFGAAAGERRPEVCCICSIHDDGVWVCVGPCCPTSDPPW